MQRNASCFDAHSPVVWHTVHEISIGHPILLSARFSSMEISSRGLSHTQLPPPPHPSNFERVEPLISLSLPLSILHHPSRPPSLVRLVPSDNGASQGANTAPWDAGAKPARRLPSFDLACASASDRHLVAK